MSYNYFRKFFVIYLIFAVLYSFVLPFETIFADDATPSVTVGNATAVATSATVVGNAESGTQITLEELTTTGITVTATITDNNSCNDLTSVKVALYKQGTTCTAAGNADADNCYFWEDTAPANNASCGDDNDMEYALSHEFSIQYYADPGTWLATVTPADEGAGTPDDSSTVTLNTLRILNVSSTISFGAVSVGSNSTGDHTATVTNTGNTAEDINLSGGALTCDGRGSIPVGNQQYALATFDYDDTDPVHTHLSATPAAVNAIQLPAPAHDTAPVTDDTYWQVGVPNGVEGTCTGTTTFTSIADA